MSRLERIRTIPVVYGGNRAVLFEKGAPPRRRYRELTIKPFHPAPERMRSPMILAFVRKTMSQKIVVTP
jgi:hypothetical protein